MTPRNLVTAPIPDARIVDALRKLLLRLPTERTCEQWRTLLGDSDTTRPVDSAVCAALLYLEQQGEVARVKQPCKATTKWRRCLPALTAARSPR